MFGTKYFRQQGGRFQLGVNGSSDYTIVIHRVMSKHKLVTYCINQMSDILRKKKLSAPSKHTESATAVRHIKANVGD